MYILKCQVVSTKQMDFLGDLWKEWGNKQSIWPKAGIYSHYRITIQKKRTDKGAGPSGL